MPVAPVTAKSIADAVQVLTNGGLVGLPTETVYGLAADATNNAAVAKIFAAKGRPHFNPLIAHFASLDAAMEVVELPGYAHKLAQELWPGPLTLVAPLKPNTAISALARDGGDTLAVRVPRLPNELQRLLSAFPQGLVAPSANPSGKLSLRQRHTFIRDWESGLIWFLMLGLAWLAWKAQFWMSALLTLAYFAMAASPKRI